VVFSGRVLATPIGHEYQSNVIFDYIEKAGIDALVMATGTQCIYLSPEQLGVYMRRFGAIPAVSIGVPVEGVSSIIIDNRHGILEAMEHLVVTHGFRRIAFLNGPERNQESRLRFEAYREALRVHGLEEDPDLSLPGDFTQPGALASMTAYLDRHHAPRFEALLAANDEMAIAAAQVLVQRGYSIPRDIAVIGFDNIQNSQFMMPSLTTVEQRLHDQGWTAGETAAKLARGESVPPTITLPTRLIIRTSCGCLPRSVVELDSPPVKVKRMARGSRGTGMIVEHCLARLARLDIALEDPSLRRILTLLVTQAGGDEFLSDFNDALSDELSHGIDISPWQSLLTILQGELVRDARPSGKGKLLETGIQKARVLLSEMLRLEQGKGWTELQGQLSSLRHVMERLISVASMEELMADLADELHRIDLRTCFIACYSSEVRHRRTDTWVIPERAEIALSCVDGIRLFPGEAERVFSPGVRFVPSGCLPLNRRYTLIATAMYFREDQIGYIVFEPGQRDNAIYETFCVQLSNLLQGSILFSARQKVVAVRARERALMAVLMDTIPDRIYFKDSESRFVLINKALAAVIGLSDPEQAIGRTDFDFYTAEHAQATFDVEQAIVRSGRPVVDLEEMETWPDGRVIWVSTTKMPLRDQTGAVVGTFGISKDITERRHTQARIIQAQRLESLGTLAGGIAHKFNNINAIIKGYMDILLESTDLSATLRNYGMEALKGVNRLVDITNRLQGLTLASGSDEATCRIDELTRALVPLFEKRFEETKTNVVLELKGVPAVRAPRSRLEFIITCLVSNALDALLDRPVRVVTIRTGTGPHTAYLDVEDTGCGIPPENIPRLFTPFFTTKGEWAGVNSAQAGARGVGLSLSVCHSTVAEYGGRIEVQSEPDAGSRFRVWLPAVEDER
ncbi:MAG: substrate-binding domain-containing protein, partial [Spirochaetia bacterium]